MSLVTFGLGPGVVSGVGAVAANAPILETRGGAASLDIYSEEADLRSRGGRAALKPDASQSSDEVLRATGRAVIA